MLWECFEFLIQESEIYKCYGLFNKPDVVYNICLHTHLLQSRNKFPLLCNKLCMRESNGTWQLVL